jgi:hypothetical protein
MHYIIPEWLWPIRLMYKCLKKTSERFSFAVKDPLCANISETSSPSTITVGRGKQSHLDKHEQVQYFIRCVGSFGA